MNMERIVAHLLARNTFAPDLQQELLEPEKNMAKVLSLIALEWSVNGRLRDLYDYELFEIPDSGVYCFHNLRTNQRFDVYLNNYNGNGKKARSAILTAIPSRRTQRTAMKQSGIMFCNADD